MRYEKKKPSDEEASQNALLAARFYLRGKAFALEEQLEKVGSRQEKNWFVVRSTTTREELLMTVTFTDLKIDRNMFSDILVGMRSHFVFQTVDAEYVEEKKMAVVFRRIVKGSVRDILCNAKWSQSYARKYGRKGGEPLSEARIASWGRHVLEGINFLRLKGLPAGHIHCGNLVVENNVCKITDYDNKLLTSLKPALMPLIQHETCVGSDPDVVCFGAVLFEMATGFPMDTVDLGQRPTRGVSAAVMNVLDAIFYTKARSRPSLEALLAMPIFASVQMPDLPPLARTRLGPKAKEALRDCRRLAPAGGAEVSKPPRLAPRPHRYADTPLAVARTVETVPVATAGARVAPAPPVAAPSATKIASPPPPPPPASAPVKAAGSAPPPPPPPAPAAPMAPPPPPAAAVPAGNRSGLLSSIQGFKGGLKKFVTVDKSKPILSKK